MTLKPTIWYPIAVVLSVINLVGAGFAARAAEPWHATIHAALALAFGLWAQRLRPGRGGSELQARVEALEALDGGESSEEVQALRNELETVRRELGELNERVDFAERLLARGRSPDAVEKRVIPRP